MCEGKKNAFMRKVAIDLTDTAFIPPNPRRTALIIGTPQTNRVTLSFNQAAVLDEGITLYPADPPLMICRKDYGDSVSGEWRAISAVAAQTITYIEVST